MPILAAFAILLAVQQPSIALPPELDRVLRDYEAAWRKDHAALPDLFTEDGFVLPNGAPPVRGRDAIRTFYSGPGRPLVLRALAYATEGTTGYIIGAFSSEEGQPDTGKFTLTLRENAAGRWLIVSDMDNGNGRQPSPAEASVRETVEAYLHGLKFNDVASLKKAFYPDAKLYFVKKDGTLGQLTQEQWYKGFEASAGKEETGDLRILSVDITGNAASVKVREEYPNSIYTDYVSLLKLGDEWKIVNKIYVAQKRN